jgi:hypothetical protein
MGQRRYLKARVAAFAAASVAAILAIPASALASGAIEGAVTEAGTGAPVASLSVCAEENYLGGVSSGCTLTGPTGHYAIGGLPAGSNYQVEFTAQGGSLNYLTQYYNGREVIPGEWDPVAVVDGGTTAGINAQVRPGAQIAGHVAEQGTGASLARVEVCILDPAPNPRAEEFERCAFTDAAGNYAVRSLRAGIFNVVFSRDGGPPEADAFPEQWWNGATAAAVATLISIAPPETRTGIDAALIGPRTYAKPKSPLHCRKHFRKRRVKGKLRCVRIHRKHGRHQHRTGNRARLT